MDIYDLIKGKVRDGEGTLEEADYLAALTEALKRFSRHRPRLVCEDLAGAASHDLDLPTGWIEGVSTVVSIEYPVGDVPETLLDSNQWTLYHSPAGLRLRLLDAAPAVTDTVRILYSALHVEATIPAADREAIASMAAAVCLRQLAARYGQSMDPTLSADAVNYQSKTDQYRRLAEALEQQYSDHLGIGADAPVSAAMTVAKPPSRRTRLTH